jgi:hypothetical protein
MNKMNPPRHQLIIISVGARAGHSKAAAILFEWTNLGFVESFFRDAQTHCKLRVALTRPRRKTKQEVNIQQRENEDHDPIFSQNDALHTYLLLVHACFGAGRACARTRGTRSNVRVHVYLQVYSSTDYITSKT